MSPERTNLILASDIPNVEPDILVRDGLDVEANCKRMVKKHASVGRESDEIIGGHTDL